MTDVHALKAEHGEALLNDANVSSVGIGLDDEGNEILVIGVKDQAEMVAVPQDLSTEDYTIEEVGEFVPEVAEAAVAPQAEHRTKHRPVPGGVSTGHVNVTAGTTSYLLTDGSATYTASNAHVYADINAGEPGDTIIQPGSADGGSAADQSATLAGSVPIEDGVTVDLAWATPDAEHTTDLLALTTPVGEPRRAEVGETVTKSGRTTQVTEGTVEQVDVTVDVNYGDAGTITLDDQVITSDMSDGGDSGSAVIGVSDDAPVGLLFAGSDTATVINQAVNVEEAAGLAIVTGEDGGGDTAPTAAITLALTKQTPDTGDIAVHATDAGTGSALAGVAVDISGETSDSGETGSDGDVVFADVPIGEYTITANTDGYDGASVTITAENFV